MIMSETAFEVAARLRPRLMRTLTRVCKSVAGDGELAEDAFSEVVLERAERVLELWDPEKSSLESYFIRTMSLYTRKWAARRRKFISGRVPRGGAVVEKGRDTTQARERNLELSLVLDQLDPYDKWIIEQHALHEYTFKEIAETLNISKGAARCHYNQALQRAQDLVD